MWLRSQVSICKQGYTWDPGRADLTVLARPLDTGEDDVAQKRGQKLEGGKMGSVTKQCA